MDSVLFFDLCIFSLVSLRVLKLCVLTFNQQRNSREKYIDGHLGQSIQEWTK